MKPNISAVMYGLVASMAAGGQFPPVAAIQEPRKQRTRDQRTDDRAKANAQAKRDRKVTKRLQLTAKTI